MARRKRYPLEWENDCATGPDGSVYAIHSAQVRGEPRIYWLVITRPGGWLKEPRLPPQQWPTKTRVRSLAERDAQGLFDQGVPSA